nr:uncharacterized protein LOC129267424 [Lytechinus pictus]
MAAYAEKARFKPPIDSTDIKPVFVKHKDIPSSNDKDVSSEELFNRKQPGHIQRDCSYTTTPTSQQLADNTRTADITPDAQATIDQFIASKRNAATPVTEQTPHPDNPIPMEPKITRSKSSRQSQQKNASSSRQPGISEYLRSEKASSRESAVTEEETNTDATASGDEEESDSDGLTAEFYRCFWDDVKYMLIDSLNEGFESQELSESQKQAVITLLHKKGDKRFTGFSDGQTITLEVPSAVERGMDTVFTCTGGASPYIFRWDDLTVVPSVGIFTAGEKVYSDNQPKYLDFSVSENGDTSIMTITNTQIEDEGKYRCAEGSLNEVANFTVEVKSTRSLVVESRVENNIDMYVGTCELHRGRPDETIFWLQGNDPALCENPEPTYLPSDPGLFSKRSTCKLQATAENNGQTLKCVIDGHQVTELNGEETQVLNLHSAPGNDIVTVKFESLDPSLMVTCYIDAANQPTPAIRNYYIYVNGTLKHESTTGVNFVELPESEYDLSTEFECVAGNYLGNTTSGKKTYDPTKTTPEPTSCSCPPSGLSSGASAGIAVLAILLVASITVNIVQFILFRRRTKAEIDDSKKNNKR